jgi:hypothetical protein
MVTINNATQNQSEKCPFVALELSGDIEMVQSQSTLRYYATVRKCTVASTLDMQTAQATSLFLLFSRIQLSFLNLNNSLNIQAPLFIEARSTIVQIQLFQNPIFSIVFWVIYFYDWLHSDQIIFLTPKVVSQCEEPY